jgi:hypothetical protein
MRIPIGFIAGQKPCLRFEFTSYEKVKFNYLSIDRDFFIWL